jgi:hypothetical protein
MHPAAGLMRTALASSQLCHRPDRSGGTSLRPESKDLPGWSERSTSLASS